jgi:erythromycin esterase
MVKFVRVQAAVVIGLFLATTAIGCRDREPKETGVSQATPVFKTVDEALRHGSRPLTGAADLDDLVERAGQARLVLLGEASHGTSEFYSWRTVLSRRLVEEHGFRFVLVEGDWASALTVNDYVKGRPGAVGSAREALRAFDRWPQWMWANEEVVELVEWLRSHNEGKSEASKVGFFGMDVYGLWDSIGRVQGRLETLDTPEAAVGAELLECLAQFSPRGHAYVQAVRAGGGSCQGEVEEVVALVARLFSGPGKDDLVVRQDAAVVMRAEAHFRLNLGGPGESWNARAEHMHETAQRLLDFYGAGSKGIVWAHNTHIGDARATPMHERGQVNIGMLSREAMAAGEVFAVGFGTHRGEVKAGRRWEAPMEKMGVPAAMTGSLEDVFATLGKPALWVMFDEAMRAQPVLRERRGHRAIGVVYEPENEVPRNYVPTDLAGRYDAFIFIAETTALRPL